MPQSLQIEVQKAEKLQIPPREEEESVDDGLTDDDVAHQVRDAEAGVLGGEAAEPPFQKTHGRVLLCRRQGRRGIQDVLHSTRFSPGSLQQIVNEGSGGLPPGEKTGKVHKKSPKAADFYGQGPH